MILRAAGSMPVTWSPLMNASKVLLITENAVSTSATRSLDLQDLASR